MQKPVVFNRYLNKRWGEENNMKIANKLETIRPMIDIKCPLSYKVFKTKLKREKSLVDVRKKKFIFRKGI